MSLRPPSASNLPSLENAAQLYPLSASVVQSVVFQYHRALVLLWLIGRDHRLAVRRERNIKNASTPPKECKVRISAFVAKLQSCRTPFLSPIVTCLLSGGNGAPSKWLSATTSSPPTVQERVSRPFHMTIRVQGDQKIAVGGELYTASAQS